MLVYFFLISFVASASALSNFCTVSGTSCTQTGICNAGFSCVFRDSVNKVCCASANLACADLRNPNTGVSDCASRRSLCNNSAYLALLQNQCPATCGFCGSVGNCVDQINPQTGVSDCPSLAARGFCNNSAYIALMQQQCRRSCGFCTGK